MSETWRVLSLCSGVGGLDRGLEAAGMTVVGFAEIDPDCRSVLARHWPDVPIHDDITTLGDDFLARVGPIDLICGGTPCTDLSVAGARAGLAGEQSRLFWEFVRIVGLVRPEWILWENVAGLLSSNGGRDWELVLEALDAHGYVVDPNLYDARYFGVPQRRRRVFLTCRLATKTVNESTPRCWLTMAQVLTECWQIALACLRGTSVTAESPWVLPAVCVDGLRRRMKLFELGTPEEPNFVKWLPNLVAAHPSAAIDGDASVTSGGDRRAATDQTATVTSSRATPTMGDGSSLTAPRWSEFLADLSELVRSCITSTPTSRTTEETICSSAKTLPGICESIAAWTLLCPDCWQPASSASTALREGTNYARQADRDLFACVAWVHDLPDIVAASERAEHALRRAGGVCGSEVLLKPESCGGDPRARPTAGPGAAGAPPQGADGARRVGDLERRDEFVGSLTAMDGWERPDNAHAEAGWLVASDGTDESDVIGALGTHGPGSGWRIGPDEAAAGHLITQAVDDIAAAVTAKWAKGSGGPAGDETQNFTVFVQHGHGAQYAEATNASGPLRASDYKRPEDHIVTSVISFDSTWSGAYGFTEDNEELSPTVKVGGSIGIPSPPAVLSMQSVRRLTPTETTRLMSWPDGWTRWRADGTEVADSARYRMCGNGVVSNVTAWIGQRMISSAPVR